VIALVLAVAIFYLLPLARLEKLFNPFIPLHKFLF
jgi:hypothetical protein